MEEEEEDPFSPDVLSADCFRDDCRPLLPPKRGERKFSFCMIRRGGWGLVGVGVEFEKKCMLGWREGVWWV